jgi:hypothetical protein
LDFAGIVFSLQQSSCRCCRGRFGGRRSDDGLLLDGLTVVFKVIVVFDVVVVVGLTVVVMKVVVLLGEVVIRWFSWKLLCWWLAGPLSSK